MFLTGVVAFTYHQVISPVSHFLQRFMSANPLLPRYIFPVVQQVEDWFSNLRTVGYVPDMKEHVPVRDGTFVTALYFCKENKNLRHEFIVADLLKPNGDQIHAFIDRCGSDLRAEAPELKAQRASERKNEDLPKSAHASTSSFSSYTFLETMNGSSDAVLDRIQKPSRANDRVQFFAGPFSPPSQSLIKRYNFNIIDRRPSLVQLAIAAIVARRYDKHYSLFRHQCYWYADCVCVVIEEMVGKDNFTVIDKTQQKGRDKDEVYLGAHMLKKIISSFASKRRRSDAQTASCEVTDAIDLEVDEGQWSKLEPGTHTFKIFTRNPVVVRWLQACLNQVTEEWYRSDRQRRETEEQRLDEQERLHKAEQKAEKLEKRVQELERMLGQQGSMASGSGIGRQIV